MAGDHIINNQIYVNYVYCFDVRLSFDNPGTDGCRSEEDCLNRETGYFDKTCAVKPKISVTQYLIHLWCRMSSHLQTHTRHRYSANKKPLLIKFTRGLVLQRRKWKLWHTHCLRPPSLSTCFVGHVCGFGVLISISNECWRRK